MLDTPCPDISSTASERAAQLEDQKKMLRTKLNHLTVPLLLLFGISSANSQSSENGLAGRLELLKE